MLDLDRSDLQNHLATPLIMLPGQTSEERMIAAAQMVERAFAVQALIAGRINWDDYLMLLDDHGIDAIAAHDGWADGICYL